MILSTLRWLLILKTLKFWDFCCFSWFSRLPFKLGVASPHSKILEIFTLKSSESLQTLRIASTHEFYKCAKFQDDPSSLRWLSRLKTLKFWDFCCFSWFLCLISKLGGGSPHSKILKIFTLKLSESLQTLRIASTHEFYKCAKFQDDPSSLRWLSRLKTLKFSDFCCDFCALSLSLE